MNNLTCSAAYMLFLACIALFACRQEKALLYTFEHSVISDSAMVVAAHPLAAQTGVDILHKGGNAVDAAVAVQFALAVVYPRAGNIGGGGFMVIRTQDGEITSLDYREKAPAGSNRNMYLDSTGNVVPGLSMAGGLAVGVPGTVDGLLKAHRQYGKLDIKTLLTPAITLAENGFRITATEAKRLNRFREDFIKYNGANFPFVQRDPWKAGDMLIQKALGKTLRKIVAQGRDGFYAGEVAKQLVHTVQKHNGIITINDLTQYQSKWREPVTGKYKNYRVISMGPPSSGGVALLQLLELIEPFPIRDWGQKSLKTIHTVVEAERRVYADRAQYLGDMDFYPVPVDSLLDSMYLAERMQDFNVHQATVSDSIASGDFEVMLESFETTHTSVVDAEGNAVSVTTTLNSNFGSKVFVKEAGFFLNNEMDDFSAKPGVPNQFGLIGAEANAVAPHKRMLSSMTPTIVEKDGELFMVLGTPGGSTIITGVLQVFLNVAEFQLPLDQAVAAPRYHHQWLPDAIWYEPDMFDTAMISQLKSMQHSLTKKSKLALVKAIHVLPDGRLHGVGDSRNADDCAEGY